MVSVVYDQNLTQKKRKTYKRDRRKNINIVQRHTCVIKLFEHQETLFLKKREKYNNEILYFAVRCQYKLNNIIFVKSKTDNNHNIKQKASPILLYTLNLHAIPKKKCYKIFHESKHSSLSKTKCVEVNLKVNF